eukprot:TRINITY_DN5607_c0_g2_i1.p1 TRINITY_DN5607_c0_g2~~TRINITY_DN5607_c0_g2_i1.p1  ORF type:complete len:367 (+),score=22.36 TRINITY_DN5607_c0_g2_i1:2-1102(+)
MARHSIRNMLVIQGLTVFTAQNSEVAGRILKGGLPGAKSIDVVVVGLSPRADLETDNRERIRTVRENFDGPVLLLATGRQSELDLLGSVKGHALVLLKPARSDRVMARLGELLGLHNDAAGPDVGDHREPGFLSGRQVLVAEDNEFNRRLIESWLLDWGATVVLARDGEEVLDRVANHRIDLILLDLHMPRVDGVSALKRLRALDDPASKLLPVIVVTADVFGAKDFMESRFSSVDIVYKPINPDLLRDTIAKMLGVEQAEGESGQKGLEGPTIPARLLSRLESELGRLGKALKLASQEGKPEEIADVLHQIHGIAGYYQMDDLEQSVRACRVAFKAEGVRGAHAEFSCLLSELLQFSDSAEEGVE